MCANYNREPTDSRARLRSRLKSSTRWQRPRVIVVRRRGSPSPPQASVSCHCGDDYVVRKPKRSLPFYALPFESRLQRVVGAQSPQPRDIEGSSIILCNKQLTDGPIISATFLRRHASPRGAIYYVVSLKALRRCELISKSRQLHELSRLTDRRIKGFLPLPR